MPEWWKQTDPRVRLAAMVAAALVNGALLLVILKGLNVDVVTKTVEVLSAFDVTEPPKPEPSPPAPEQTSQSSAGAAAPAARKAVPKEVMAPEKTIPVRKDPAPRATSTGSATTSGGAQAGAGTGAGGSGAGTGSGGSGSGSGGGSRKPEKIAGVISENARDYPASGREDRRGRTVIISYLVGKDGRVSDCRVVQPSGNAEADAITCRLAVERFRYKPALDAAGNPIAVRTGWRQTWRAP